MRTFLVQGIYALALSISASAALAVDDTGADPDDNHNDFVVLILGMLPTDCDCGRYRPLGEPRRLGLL